MAPTPIHGADVSDVSGEFQSATELNFTLQPEGTLIVYEPNTVPIKDSRITTKSVWGFGQKGNLKEMMFGAQSRQIVTSAFTNSSQDDVRLQLVPSLHSSFVGFDMRHHNKILVRKGACVASTTKLDFSIEKGVRHDRWGSIEDHEVIAVELKEPSLIPDEQDAHLYIQGQGAVEAIRLQPGEKLDINQGIILAHTADVNIDVVPQEDKIRHRRLYGISMGENLRQMFGKVYKTQISSDTGGIVWVEKNHAPSHSSWTGEVAKLSAEVALGL